MREWKRYKLDDGTIVDEIVNADGVVITKTVTPPQSATPMTAEDWEKVLADAGVAVPPPDHVWDFGVASDDLPLNTGLHFEAGDSLCYQQHVTGWTRQPLDPLDVEYDGVKLRELLAKDETYRRESLDVVEAVYRKHYPSAFSFTPSQRAAISDHWSAELRQRVEAAKEKQRTQVVVEGEEEE